MLHRRHVLKSLVTGAGAALTLPLSANITRAASTIAKQPKRIIFFLQNQGFDPKTCIPADMKKSGSLADVTLPEPISPLEPYKDKIHIINGLHGKHTSPSHSAYFGALGGYRGGIGVPPFAETIDHVLTGILPETILPHLCIGMDAIENMRSRPTLATLSAAGPGKPIFMYSNPCDLYQMLFGVIATGDVKKRFDARSEVFNRIEWFARKAGQELPEQGQQLYSSYTEGFRDVNGLREKLAQVAGHLQQFAPVYGDKFENPEFETDWHDSLLDVGIAAMKAGLTNVLTIGSGRGEIFGSWKGLGVVQAGHNLGHMDQPDNPIWIKIRQYNCRMLVKMMQELESVPEGNGTMMDNTLIVYTSNNADKQHTAGGTWPFILLGNFGGKIKTGQFTQYDGRRPINALYNTLLQALNRPTDHFNLDSTMSRKHDSGSGPLEELLA